MKLAAFGLVLAALVAAPSTAAAQRLHANPVSWSPADARAGDRVTIVLQLSRAGVEEVEVVIRREDGLARRFPTVDLGSGRYRTTITFPSAGDWHLRVSHRAEVDGPTEEILLGKGGIRIDGPPSAGRRRPATGTPPGAVLGALVLLLCLSGLAVAASRSASRGTPALPG